MVRYRWLRGRPVPEVVAPVVGATPSDWSRAHDVMVAQLRAEADGAVKTVCVDFDGTMTNHAPYKPGLPTAAPQPKLRETLQTLRTQGYRIVVLTARPPSEIYSWLVRYDVNDLVDTVTNTKPPAVAYIDDRGVHFDGRWETVLRQVTALDQRETPVTGHDEIKNVDAAGDTTNIAPTPGQVRGGNYKKRNVLVHGLPISIENEPGSLRVKYNPDGSVRWASPMPNAYGYIRGSIGADKDHIDCFLHSNAAASDMAHVINQLRDDGSFDEHKIMLGWPSQRDALDAYAAHYPPGWAAQHVGSIHSVPVAALKVWLAEGARKQAFAAKGEFDESKHKRDDEGKFATTGSGGASAPRELADGQETSRPTEAQRLENVKKYHALKDEWAKVNNDLLHQVDAHDSLPDTEAVRAKVTELKGLVKQMYRLDADPGGLEGIGLPGGPRDVVIVGAGPGGLAAGVMGGTDGLDTLVIEAQPRVGGQAKHSSRIENYPGFPIGISGKRLANRLFDQAERVGADAKLGVKVTGLTHDPKTGLKTITLDTGETIEARAVVIASGLQFKKMSFPGSDSEKVVYGDGETLETMCEGKPVVIVGGSNAAAQAALGAARKASHVYVLSRSPIDKSMSNYQVSGLKNHENITIIEGDEIGEFVEEHGKLVTKKGREIPAAAMGVFVGSAPETSWLPKEIETQDGKVVHNPDLETAVPGVFVVGDVRYSGMGRIGAAVGDGQVAMRNIASYFEKQKSAPPEDNESWVGRGKQWLSDRLADASKRLASAAEGPRALLGEERAAAADEWDELVDALFALDEDEPFFSSMAEYVAPAPPTPSPEPALQSAPASPPVAPTTYAAPLVAVPTPPPLPAVNPLLVQAPTYPLQAAHVQSQEVRSCLYCGSRAWPDTTDPTLFTCEECDHVQPPSPPDRLPPQNLIMDAAEWNETDHPRDENGQFTDGQSEGKLVTVKRVAPGYYTTPDGEYEISKTQPGQWSWNKRDKGADDVFSTKHEALIALTAWISKTSNSRTKPSA